METIFEYLDYRTFLKDFFESRKSEFRSYSYRNISQKIGIKSTGFLSMVIKGERNISEQVARDLCDALKLSTKEKRFFIALVRFNQSSESEQKSEQFSLIRSMQSGPVRNLTTDEQEFYHKWYYAAVRELITIFPIAKNFKAAAVLLRPVITAAEMEDAIATLERLQMIHFDGTRYRRSEKVVLSGNMIEPFILHQFQHDTLKLAGEALTRFPREKRELSTITMSVDSSSAALIRQKLDECRREIIEIARTVNSPESVLQLNMQIFPLSIEKTGGLA